jgi:hypothetical protein
MALRPPPLPIGPFSGGSGLIKAGIPLLVAHLYDTINELKRLAILAESAKQFHIAGELHHDAGLLAIRQQELGVGRSLKVQAQVLHSQADLVPWRDLPPEVQKKIGDALDAVKGLTDAVEAEWIEHDET